MTTTSRSAVLRDALQEILGILDEEGVSAPWSKRAKKIASQALYLTAGPDPILQLSGDLFRLTQDLGLELGASAGYAARGELWTCIEVPELLRRVNEIAARAGAAGVPQ